MLKFILSMSKGSNRTGEREGVVPEPQRFIWTPHDESGEGLFAIPVPFDAKALFGKARAPVVVYDQRLQLSQHHRQHGWPALRPAPNEPSADAAGVKAGIPVEVTLALDEELRTVDVPDDLAAALDAIPGGRETWDKASFTHRREYVEALLDAKKPETRQKRLEKAIAFVKRRIK